MTAKIKISGVPRKYDEIELKRLQEDYHKMYRQSSQCLERVQANFPYDLITIIIEKSKLGYVLCERSPIRTLSLDYSAYMIKTPELQKLDLTVIDADVKAQYVKELEAELQEYRELLTQQLLDKALEKEAKKLEDAHKKRMEAIAQEVNDVFGELVIPDCEDDPE